MTKPSTIIPFFGFLIVSAILTLPILLHPYLPLVDLPNHIARHYIASLSGADESLLQYYEFTNSIVPNSAADLLFRIVDWKGSPYLFSRLIIGFYLVNLMFAVMVMARFLNGKWSIWPLATGLVAYNANFFMGFENFLFSAPFVIHGLTLWIAIEQRKIWLRILIFICVGFVLYYMHLLAFASLAIFAMGRELQQVSEQDRGGRWRYLRTNIFLAIPFLLPILFYLFKISSAVDVDGDYTYFGGFAAKISTFLSVTLSSLGRYTIPDVTRLNVMSAVVVYLLLITIFASKGVRLALHPKLKGVVIFGSIVALVAPGWLDGVAFVHTRLPFLVVAIAIAGSTWKNLSKPISVAFFLLVAGLLAARVWTFNDLTAQHSREVAEVLRVSQSLPAGARVLPLRSVDFTQRRRFHLQAYSLIERQVFIPTLFQGTHTLFVKPEWSEYAHPTAAPLEVELLFLPVETQLEFAEMLPTQYFGNYYWLDWQEKFTHVMLLQPVEYDLEARLPLTLIERGEMVELYEVRQD